MSESEEAWEMIDEVASELKPEEYYQLTLDQINSDIYETTKDMYKSGQEITPYWALALHHDVLLREAVRTVGEDAVRAKYPLPPEEPEPVVYPDGSTDMHVVMEEVYDAISRYNFYPDEVMLEVLDWSKAAQAAFQRVFKEQGDPQ